MSDSRKLYEIRKILITAEQRSFIHADADDRYPERHGSTAQRRNFNPAIRDGIDGLRAVNRAAVKIFG